LSVDLPAIPAIGLGSSIGGGGGNENVQDEGQDGWGWFLKAWRKEEKLQRESVANLPQTADMRQRERETKREKDDAVVKASTDKLSAVFDWVTERVPSSPLLSTTKATAGSESGSEPDSFRPRKPSSKDTRKKNDLESKEDLERFYIALSRKLYDEGL
jgi:triacylglycerol lipase